MVQAVFFKGNSSDFLEYLKNKNVECDKYFLDIIKDDDNIKLTVPNNPQNMEGKEIIKNLVVMSSDFSSVNNHVISNFYNMVIKRHNVRNIYIQNPPVRIERSMLARIGKENVRYEYSNYKKLSESEVIQSYYKIQNSSNFVGQKKAKKRTFINLYKQALSKNKNPLVLMFYGVSGVGKTVFAKEIGKLYNSEVTRLQFSMMQTETAVNYLFGSDNTKPSLAVDLLNRKSNIILIDEFDKANPIFYNAFYQMFDEGYFEDTNYRVSLNNCIFILTSNFLDLDHISKRIGVPLFSRLDDKIKFIELNRNEYRLFVENIFQDLLQELTSEQQKIIQNSNLKSCYLNANNRQTNNRMLKKIIEKDIYSLLFEKAIQNSISID